jgi:hypothetical protein
VAASFRQEEIVQNSSAQVKASSTARSTPHGEDAIGAEEAPASTDLTSRDA